MSLAQLVLLILLGCAGFQTLHYMPLMPPVIASHFGPGGVANGWSTPGSFFTIYWGVLALMMLSFYALPVLLRRLPVSIINLPNREYWLAPERQKATLEALGAQMNWFGNAMVAFIITTFQFAIEANLGQAFPNDRMWLLIGTVFAFTIGWLVLMYRRFPRPPR